jgi:hypothetical protein
LPPECPDGKQQKMRGAFDAAPLPASSPVSSPLQPRAMQAEILFYAITSHVPSGRYPLYFKTQQGKFPSINFVAGPSA